jgi:hypothetical protein
VYAVDGGDEGDLVREAGEHGSVFVVGCSGLSMKIGTPPDVSQVFADCTTQTQHGYDRRVHGRRRERHLGHEGAGAMVRGDIAARVRAATA